MTAGPLTPQPPGGLLNSWHRCPHCGKRLVLDLGRDDDEHGRIRGVHTCWNCGYSRTD